MKFRNNFDMPHISPTYTGSNLSLSDDFETAESIIAEDTSEMRANLENHLQELLHLTATQALNSSYIHCLQAFLSAFVLLIIQKIFNWNTKIFR